MNWVRLGSIGFVFSNGPGVVCSGKPLRQRELRWVWPWKNWVCFAKNRAICRGVSTSVERWLIENAKTKVQSGKLRNPDLVGMGVLVVDSLSISRILYLLDVYYIRWEVGCQVNFSFGHRLTPITTDECMLDD